MTQSWVTTMIIAALAIVLALVHVWLLKVQLSPENFAVALAFSGSSLALGFIAWVIKGFSVRSFLVVVAIGYAGLLLGTWGRPGRMFEILLKEGSLTPKQARWFQIRLILVLLTVAAISSPLILAMA